MSVAGIILIGLCIGLIMLLIKEIRSGIPYSSRVVAMLGIVISILAAVLVFVDYYYEYRWVIVGAMFSLNWVQFVLALWFRIRRRHS